MDSELTTAAPAETSSRAWVGAAVAASAALTACLEDATPTTHDASRFLSQATPGHSMADVEALTKSSIRAWLDAQFQMPRERTHWDWMINVARANTSNIVAKVFYADMVYWSIWRRLISCQDVLRARMMFALSQIFVVAPGGLGNRLQLQYYVAGYMDLLDEHAFGNFRNLLEAVSLSPAMGFYLSHAGNAKAEPATGRTPDENYAREVMQLFSIGLYQLNLDGSIKKGADGQPIETYQQDDVVKLARVFTGWDIDNPPAIVPTDVLRSPMTMHESLHSQDDKRFLGTDIPAGSDGMTSLKLALDALFNHPNVGPFIGKQLIQRLVTSNPSPTYVRQVAQAFNNDGQGVRGNLQAVLRAILLHPEARLPINDGQRGKLCEPALRFVHFARAFGATSSNGLWRVHDSVSTLNHDLSDSATGLGEQPMASPSVFNFFRPGYVPPNTEMAQLGLFAPEFQIVNESTVVGYVNYMQTVITNGLRDYVAPADADGQRAWALKPDYAAWLPRAAQPALLLADLNTLFAAGRIGAPSLQAMQTAIETLPADDDAGRLQRVQCAVLLVMATPEYIVQQ